MFFIMAEAMNNNIEELLSVSYELEGLLMVVARRVGSVPDQVWSLLAQKSALLHDGIGQMLAERAVEPVSVEVSADTSDNDDAKAPVVVDEVPEKLAEADIAALEDVEDTSVPESVITEIPDSVSLAPEAVDIVEDDTKLLSEEQLCDEDLAVEEYAVSAATPDATPEPLRLDEKLARESSRNLRKAFSLNDRFRFRRELFGNSDIEMTDTLNLVEAMTSYDEAVDYFMTDLQWDADNAEVKDFMAIVEKHFSIR